MTTKIIRLRDLTDKEAEKICDKHYKKYVGCFCCPLEIDKSVCFRDINLDRYIEVEYDESK